MCLWPRSSGTIKQFKNYKAREVDQSNEDQNTQNATMQHEIEHFPRDQMTFHEKNGRSALLNAWIIFLQLSSTSHQQLAGKDPNIRFGAISSHPLNGNDTKHLLYTADCQLLYCKIKYSSSYQKKNKTRNNIHGMGD